MGKTEKQEELLQTLGDFTSKENWDKFFSIRGNDDSFEWYAEWPELRDHLLSHLRKDEDSSPGGSAFAEAPSTAESASVHILVPGCGNSRLSEHLYDAGFRGITNIDYSKVVISDMLRRNVRLRPDMRWRVMDMTNMQFKEDTFDAVVDKGGLDALMEPKIGSQLGNQYLSEVKRVLKYGGKFICLTLAESHVLGLLLPKFRYGWKLSLHAISQKPSNKPSLQTFMVIAEKISSTVLHLISSSLGHSSLNCYEDQARGLCAALESENRIRTEYSKGSDILYSLEDLQLGVKGDLAELSPGRRVQLTLGEQGGSNFCYRAVLFDARQQFGPFSYNCSIFLVPKTRAHEWLFSSEEGQWLVVERSKAARLIMVLLDASHSTVSMDEIQKDLSPLVKQLAPLKDDNGAQIPFMAASDGIKQRKIVKKVTSALTGPIVVDDVVYEKVDDDLSRLLPSKELIFRRLTFQRAEALVQSEALLTSDGSSKNVGEIEQKKTRSSSKLKRKGNQRRNESHVSLIDEPSKDMKVDHNYLASSYHTGIISGFVLVSSFLDNAASSGRMVKVIVIGLGAGLLPMFLHECLPFSHIEVVELDPVVLDLARDCFGFKEDERLEVHIADGIQFIREFADFKLDGVTTSHESDGANWNGKPPSSHGTCALAQAEYKRTNGIDILIVDVDSSDSSSGMTCPAADFVGETFLLTVKSSLSEQGLFIINLVSRSPVIKDLVISRMNVVFSNLFSLQLEEDVNEVLFAFNSGVCSKEDQDPEASLQLQKLLKLKHQGMSQNIMDAMKKIKCLK